MRSANLFIPLLNLDTGIDYPSTIIRGSFTLEDCYIYGSTVFRFLINTD